MNNHQKGYRRDRTVIEALKEWGTLDTEQLRILFYPSVRVAQRRLKILVGKGKIRRFRESVELPYIYCIGKADTVRLTLNWLRIWLLRRLKSWEVIEEFDYSTNTCSIRNTIAGSVRTYTILYNANRRSWIGGDTFIIYDTEEHRKEAIKRGVTGILLTTVDEVREGLKCVKCS